MIADTYLPPACAPPAVAAGECRGLAYSAAAWSPDDLERLASRLVRSGEAMAQIATDDLLRAWGATVAAFRDPRSEERQSLDEALRRSCGLSAAGLSAGLEAVLGGVRLTAAAELASQAPDPVPRGLLLIVLAANLPALAVQPLLPALLLRRPVILKSPSAEPFFAPAFLGSLCRRLPALASAVAAVTWRGGDYNLERPLLAAAERIVAYGDQEALDDLGSRFGGEVIGYGPRLSLAVLGADVAPSQVAAGLARDVALFDQRGCLSIHAVFTAGDAPALAAELAAQLVRRASDWPPGPVEPTAAAAVQQLRGEAEMRGLGLRSFGIATGTVVIEPLVELRPSPGLRTVRIHPLADLQRLPEVLARWRGRLQGVALLGSGTADLRPAMEALGASHFATPGELQSPDALWHNGGLHPLAALL